MSYILEALRRSQEERESGTVPRLETDAYAEPAESSGINFWVVAALTLAALAVVIAIYAAIQARPGELDQVRNEPAETLDSNRGSESWSLSDDGRVPDGNGSWSEESAHGEGSLPLVGREAQVADAPSATMSDAPASPPLLPVEEEPLVAPPPPKPRPVPQVARLAPRPASVPPPISGGLDVPEDIVRDIETFKEDLRIEQAVGSGRSVPRQPVPKDPRDLRLPPEIALRLPAFVMSVHVYEKKRDQRFVVINARKYRQGATTREQMVVERIMPNGAVLSYEGHRFYSPR